MMGLSLSFGWMMIIKAQVVKLWMIWDPLNLPLVTIELLISKRLVSKYVQLHDDFPTWFIFRVTAECTVRYSTVRYSTVRYDTVHTLIDHVYIFIHWLDQPLIAGYRDIWYVCMYMYVEKPTSKLWTGGSLCYNKQTRQSEPMATKLGLAPKYEGDGQDWY